MLFRGITLSYVLQREGSLVTGASFYRGVSCAAGLAYTDILVDTKRSGFARGTTIQCPVPLTVRGTQALVSFAPLAFKLFFAARQNAVLRRSPFPPP